MAKKINKRVKASKAFVEFDTSMRFGGEIEYIMPMNVYIALEKECRENKLGDLQKFLCDYVNDQYGLLGTCVRVIPA